jgi:hypothetical protein
MAQAPTPAPVLAPAPAYGAPKEEEKGWADTLKGYVPDISMPKKWPWESAETGLVGGRKRARMMRGGDFGANAPLSLATNASPISGINSARPHNWVGGRTRGRRCSNNRGRSRGRGGSKMRGSKMRGSKMRGSKMRGSRRSKKGGDDIDNTWDIEMGPRSESPAYINVAQDADDMEKGLTKFSPEPEQGDEKVGGKRRRGTKSKKHYKKGAMSKTRKGRKDFVTHKGDKYFHRRGHRQTTRQ